MQQAEQVVWADRARACACNACPCKQLCMLKYPIILCTTAHRFRECCEWTARLDVSYSATCGKLLSDAMQHVKHLMRINLRIPVQHQRHSNHV